MSRVVKSSLIEGPTSICFRNSGRVDVSGTLVSLVVSTAAGMLMAILYALVVRSLPSEEICGLACIGFGVMLGLIPAAMMHKLKVRNFAVTLLVVLIATAAAYYVAWVMWEATFFRHAVTRTAWLLWRHPAIVYDIGRAINHDGAWSLGSDHHPVTGLSLSLMWLAEAVIIFGTAILISKNVFGSAAFCETCRRWCPSPKTLRTSALMDARQLRRQLEARDYSFVSHLQPARGPEYLTFMRQSCPTCGQLNLLTVTARTAGADRKGRRKSTVRKIINRLIVEPADFEHFATPTAATPANIADPG